MTNASSNDDSRQASLSLYSDLYKGLYGVRPRWDYDLSEEELDRRIQALDAEIQDRILDDALGWQRYAPTSTFSNTIKFS